MNLTSHRRTAVLGLALLLFTACSSGAGPSRVVSSSSSSADSASSPAPSQPVVLTVLDWGGGGGYAGYDANARRVDADFTANYPNVKIVRQKVSYADTPVRLRALIAAHDGPDILPSFPGAYAASFKNGFEDLNGYVTREQRQVWPLLKSSVSLDGKLYAVADTAYAYAMGYNKRLFASAGITAPPKTWDELKNACSVLSAKGITPIAAGWKDGFYGEGWMYQFIGAMLTLQQRHQFFSYQLPLNDPKIQQALSFLVDLNRAGCFGTGAEGRLYYDDVRNQFATGKTAMVLDLAGEGPMEEGNLYPTSLGGAFDVFALPSPPGAANAQFMDYGPNAGWGIAKWSHHKAAAWLYITYLMSEKVQQSNWASFKALPAVSDVKIKSSFRPSKEILSWATDWPANGTVYTAFPQSVLAVYEKQMVDVMTGRTNVASLTNNMQKALDVEKARLTG